MPLDETTLQSFTGKLRGDIGDLGGAVSIPLVRIGDALGLYTALDRLSIATPEELAAEIGFQTRHRNTPQHGAQGQLRQADTEHRSVLP